MKQPKTEVCGLLILPSHSTPPDHSLALHSLPTDLTRTNTHRDEGTLLARPTERANGLAPQHAPACDAAAPAADADQRHSCERALA